MERSIASEAVLQRANCGEKRHRIVRRHAGDLARTVAASSGLSIRRNGLVAFSSAIVLGIVGLLVLRSAWTVASFSVAA